MSSDSDEDCYGNVAQKLHSMKRQYKEDRIEATNLLDESLNTPKKPDNIVLMNENTIKKYDEVPKPDSDCEDISLDDIIAKNSKKRGRRSSKRVNNGSDITAANILPGRGRKRLKTSVPDKSVVESPAVQPDLTPQNVIPEPVVNISNVITTPRGRTRRRKRGSRGDNTPNTTSRGNSSAVNDTEYTPGSDPEICAFVENISRILHSRGSRGRGRRRSRRGVGMGLPDYFPVLDTDALSATCSTSQVASNGQSSFNLGNTNPDIEQTTSNRRQSNSNRNAVRNRQIDNTSYPTYSIGNTAEYPDECYDQPLFSKQNTTTEEVVVVGEYENDPLAIDENEELSVKVYWQNRECIKFNIRRFQKLTQIFDFFAKRENISHDKLFFTYNDKILKIDDTPDSITYNIVKFIDGGIINQSVSQIVKKDRTIPKDGIKLKFQCQNVKKPFEISIRLDDKMAVAMMMCAEHLEKPLEQLKFQFDGDLIPGKSTARELELEGGECIDVIIT